MVRIFQKESEISKENYFLVDYFLEAKTSLRDAAWNLAIGQSIGNPSNRSVWETEQMFIDHSCLILADENELLGKSENPQETYIKEIMPAKLELNKKYLSNPTISHDISIMWKTFMKMIK